MCMVGQKSFFGALGDARWNVARLAISIAIPLSAGAIGAIFTTDSVETWYQMIEKPWFTPPNWLFGPAWTVLYVLMGISLYLVWRKTTIDRSIHGTRPAVFAVFGIQLGLNALWSFLFFGLRSPQLAFAEIVILLASIMVTVIIFQKISKPASILLLPYAGWVAFASALNLGVWLLNAS